MPFKAPKLGIIFWPVGTGDSTTIVVNDSVFVQVDLNDLNAAQDEDDPHTPVVDELLKLLPEIDDEKYLSTFVLTHPDQDHCKGFANLLDSCRIGELWFTPRVFREYKKDLCDDAIAFRDEAMRRVKAVIDGEGVVSAGDRVRIVGYDDLLREEDFKGFPRQLLSVPGTPVTAIDGVDQAKSFRAFIHAPFKDDADGERNDTSLGMQVRLTKGDKVGRALLLGDLAYPVVKRIFEKSTADDLGWNVLLAPHHCSKSVMYWQEEGDDDENLKQDILDMMEERALDPGYVIASSEPVPSSNESGDNPPHAKAKARYEEIAPSGFICTQEHPNQSTPKPVTFALGDAGFAYVSVAGEAQASNAGRSTLAAGVDRGRGGAEPPKDRVGFGPWR